MNQKNQETPNLIVEVLRSAGLTAAGGFGCFWITTNYTSEEWRLAAMVLGVITAFLALATVISLFSLLLHLGVAASGQVFNFLMRLLRFEAFQKLLAYTVGLSILVTGFTLTSLYDPKWSFIPAAVGAVIMLLPTAWSVLRERPWFHRIFRSGQKPQAEFAQSYHLKQVAHPLRKDFRAGAGYCSDSLFIGTSTPETS